MLIRAALTEDLAAVRDIGVTAIWETFGPHNTQADMEAYLDEAYQLSQLQKEHTEPHARLFVAEENNTILGFVRTRITAEVEHYLGKNTVELQRLYIHPDHQGKKVGSSLMTHTLDYANRSRFDWIWLGVWERNFKAQKFYHHWGFERFSEHIFQMGSDPQTDWLFKKKLGKL